MLSIHLPKTKIIVLIFDTQMVFHTTLFVVLCHVLSGRSIGHLYTIGWLFSDILVMVRKRQLTRYQSSESFWKFNLGLFLE